MFSIISSRSFSPTQNPAVCLTVIRLEGRNNSVKTVIVFIVSLSRAAKVAR